MTTIQCVNPQCTSPHRPPTFEWDERPHLLPGGSVVAAGTAGSKKLQIPCPYCGTINTIGVIGLKPKDGIDRIVRK